MPFMAMQCLPRSLEPGLAPKWTRSKTGQDLACSRLSANRVRTEKWTSEENERETKAPSLAFDFPRAWNRLDRTRSLLLRINVCKSTLSNIDRRIDKAVLARIHLGTFPRAHGKDCRASTKTNHFRCLHGSGPNWDEMSGNWTCARSWQF